MTLACKNCNGWSHSGDCPDKLNIGGTYYRVLSVKEFTGRRKKCYRKMNQDRDDAWEDLEYVHLYCPSQNELLPISSMPIVSRMFVEKI